MKLIAPGESFLYDISLPILKEDGTSLEGTHYEIIEDDTHYGATWSDRLTLTLKEETIGEGDYPVFYMGDNVILTVNGFTQLNSIVGVDSTNHKVKLSKVISTISSTVTITKNYYTYVIKNTCANGYYRFSNNELIIVRDDYLNLFVNYDTLRIHDKNVVGLLEESELVAYNSEGMNGIYADLSYIPDAFRLLDGGQIKQLLTYKILSLIEEAHYDNKSKFAAIYQNKLKQILTPFKLDKITETSDVEKDIDNEESGTQYHLGA